MRLCLFVLTIVFTLLHSMDANALFPAMDKFDAVADMIGEVSAPYGHLHVTSATLNINVRGSGAHGRQPVPVEVDSIYQIDNRAEAGDHELFFFNPIVSTGTVKLNGRVLQGRQTEKRGNVKWRMPRYNDHEVPPGVMYLAPMRAGANTLEISYTARSGVRGSRVGPHFVYDVKYHTATARSWGGFKNLTINAYVPKGWGLYSSLGEVNGEHWEATFEKVPTDGLVLKAVPFEMRSSGRWQKWQANVDHV